MIVFTATNRRTHHVFVGKAQDSVDEEWAQMLEQADAGAEGTFFDLLRENPLDFEVETWAYAETPAEARESFREAREDLDAEVIKVPRSRPGNSNTQPIRSASMKALMDSIREASDDYDANADEESLGLEAAEGEAPVEAEPSAAPVAAVEKAGDSTEEKAANAANSDLDDAARLQARIDAMKAAQEKVLRNKETEAALRQPGTALKKTKVVSKAKPKVVTKPKASKAVEAAPMKVANGRTGSAAKEARIKEAIQQDRENRDSFRAQSNHGQQAEMNALMARVEMRRTAQKVKKQEEAKKRAAAVAKEKKAAEKAALQAKKEAEKLRKQAEALSKAVSHGKVELTQAQAEELVNKSRALDAAEKEASLNATHTAPVASAAEPAAPAEKTKEDRVREGMAQQREMHVKQRRAQANQEADEMANLLSRLDARSRDRGASRRRG